MAVKICKGFWLSADNYNYIITKLIHKSEEKYESQVKAAIKSGKGKSSVKRYIVKTTFANNFINAVAQAKTSYIRNHVILSKNGDNEGTIPKGAKKVEDLVEMLKGFERDFAEECKQYASVFSKEELVRAEKLEKAEEQIKKLKLELSKFK